MKKPSRAIDDSVLEAIRRMPCAACNPSWYLIDVQNQHNPQGLHISDPSHIRSRGAGGGDEPWNLLPMCRPHHNTWHRIGVSSFLKRFPHVWRAMQKMGWKFEMGGLYHEKEIK